MPEYLLPDVGEGLVEAEIVTWRVAVGDTVAINDVVVEIETAKSIVELPTPYAGRVDALLAAPGEMVAVGAPILRILAEGEAPAAAPAPGEGDDSAAAPETLVGYGPRATVSRRRTAAGVAAPPAKPHDRHPLQGETGARRAALPGPGSPLAKPPVRLLARERGVDLNDVFGTGAGGVITAEDIELISGVADPEPQPTDGREWREPVKGVRKAMAQAMVDSAFTAPHVTTWHEIDATKTVRYVERLKSDPAYAGVKVSPLVVVARACIQALRHVPEANARWTDTEIVHRRYVNLGIAAATPRGLLVPNIKDAADLSLPELARALETLTTRAREGLTQPAEQAGGTFTITNIGVLGVDGGTPIINPGESAILAVGAIRKKPWVIREPDGADGIAIRSVTTLALSFDHRMMDGQRGSQLLADICSILEDPEPALAW